MNNEWTPIGREMPEDSQFVIANIRNGNYYYHEILCYKAETGNWHFHNEETLPEGAVVTAWQELPSTYVS